MEETKQASQNPVLQASRRPYKYLNFRNVATNIYTKGDSTYMSDIMEDEKTSEFRSFLRILPPVEFACVYGSSLHPNNQDQSSMTDFILGVSDPYLWHYENLKLNRNHYASWMVHLGGARLVTEVADKIGVGVHFNPFVRWNRKIFKYGVVRIHDLLQDIRCWERFYLSGRLQKPIHIVIDKLDIANNNVANLRAAISAALLCLPSESTEEDLYSKVCSLSYMGDLRMLFAEDKNKVKKIVTGQFDLFHSMYKPFLEEYEAKKLLRLSSNSNHRMQVCQNCHLSATSTLVSSLPSAIRNQMGVKLGEKTNISETGKITGDISFRSREEAAKCLQRILRRRVMISSARQAISGLLTSGGVNSSRYLAKKICKAWNSWR